MEIMRRIPPIPKERLSISPWDKMEDVVYERIRIMLENPHQNSDFKADKFLHNFYQSCTKNSSLKTFGLEPWKYCINKLGFESQIDIGLRYSKLALASLHVRTYIDPNTGQTAKNIANNVHAAFQNLIEASCMDR